MTEESSLQSSISLVMEILRYAQPSTVSHHLRTEVGARLCNSFARGSLRPFSTPLATSWESALRMTHKIKCLAY